MHRIILFRGGMVGDLILNMIDPTSTYNKKLKSSRTRMKKFFKYSEIEKEMYFHRLNKSNRICYTLSHDTNFALMKDPIQLICSDLGKLHWISYRFLKLHRTRVIQEVINVTNCTSDNFVECYAKNIKDWQDYHIARDRFDIRNIGNIDFLDDVCNKFKCNIHHATLVYHEWLIQNKFVVKKRLSC